MFEVVATSIIATLIVVILSVPTMVIVLRVMFRELGVSKAELRAGFDKVLDDPRALSHFVGAVVIALALLLGQVYS